MLASAAWMLPTCLCSRPERARMKTSYSGHCFCCVMVASPSGSQCFAHAALLCVCERSVANPASAFVRTATRFDALAVARTVARQDLLEFAPVDLAKAIVLTRL